MAKGTKKTKRKSEDAMSNRKFYRTTVTIEILGEEPIDESMSLRDIEYEITDGHFSGRLIEHDVEVLSGSEMARALISQGSDPEFLGLDNYGNDIEDYYG